MNVEEARESIRRFGKELVERKLTAERATQQALGLQTIIRGYVEMFPELAAEAEDLLPALPLPDDGTPKGAEAVQRIMQESPSERLFVSELVPRLRNRGWLPESSNPANAVRTALERLVNTEGADVYKVKVGTNVAYYYDPDRDPSEPPRAEMSPFEEEPF